MNYIKELTKYTLGEKIINRINYFIRFRFFGDFEKYKKNSENKILYTLIPKHGNMGNQAIDYATMKFLHEYFLKRNFKDE